MNVRSVIRVVAALVAVIGLFMASAALVGWLMQDPPEVISGLLVCALAAMVAGLAGMLAGRGRLHLGLREGFAIVTFGWLAAALAGSLPLWAVSGLNWHDAFFETMSGFTTTGASILDAGLPLRRGGTLSEGIADIAKGVLFWRSLTHWLGGMGIVVLSVAILPSLGIGGHQLYHAEVPGPTSDQLTPRIADSAKILWAVYVLLSVLETLLLAAGGMPLFDAWCHTCGTLATGGFSTQQASIGAYNSVYFEVVITVFMFLAGANFILHFRALRGKPLSHFNDEEFRFYALLCVVGIATITLSLLGTDISSSSGTVHAQAGPFTALRYASFQVISIITTTGFVTADFNLWPAYCTMLLVVFMFVGGCGGSTGGGMKNARVILLLKYAVSQVERCVFPRSVSNIQLNGQRIDPAILHKTLSFFFLFVGLFVLFGLLLSLLGAGDLATASTASIASLGNIGPGLGNVGATSTYAWMSPPAKLLLTFVMLLGRLELYTVLVLLLPSSY